MGGLSRRVLRASCAALILLLVAPATRSDGPRPSITLVSTTTTQASGFLDHVLPPFEARTGIEVRVIAVGTGAALRLGRAGDVDAVLVHDPEAEAVFVAEGHGLRRRPIMRNDFVLVGPADDPAGIRGETALDQALLEIAKAKAVFVSRGDDSGTHRAERRLWKRAGYDPTGESGGWYREIGGGMGAALNIAAALGSYVLCDRGSYLAFENRRGLVLLAEGHPPVVNEYAITVVNPERHPGVKAELAGRLADWLVSAEGQARIGSLRRDGEPLFHPIAAPPPPEARDER